ncbi:hypothetical protein ACTMU2_17075 [Cupriavidus basilensis]
MQVEQDWAADIVRRQTIYYDRVRLVISVRNDRRKLPIWSGIVMLRDLPSRGPSSGLNYRKQALRRPRLDILRERVSRLVTLSP